jgi:hypothetical protein
MLQEQQQQLLQLQQQPAGSNLLNNLLPNYGSSGALRVNGSAGGSGKKGSRLPSPAGPGVVGSSSSSAVNSLPMELPALPAAAEEAECLASGVGAGGAAAPAKHRQTDSLLAAAGKQVSASANAAAWCRLQRFQCYCDSMRLGASNARDLARIGALPPLK